MKKNTPIVKEQKVSGEIAGMKECFITGKTNIGEFTP